MIKTVIFLILMCVTLSACASLEQIRADNRQKLTGLSAGMSKQEVLSLMGTKTVRSGDGTIVTNPHRTEMYRAKNSVFELLLYYTEIKKSDGAITDDELIPLVLKDGKLDGWGWSYWENVTQKLEIRVR